MPTVKTATRKTATKRTKTSTLPKRGARKTAAPKVPAIKKGTVNPARTDARAIAPDENLHTVAHTGTKAASRQPGDPRSTAIHGPGPASPTDEAGNFKGEPGVDVQGRIPLSPAEVRNPVSDAVQHEKPETNVSRADTEGIHKIAPGVRGYFEARVVGPAEVDEANVKSLADAKDVAAEQSKMGSSPKMTKAA